MTRFAFSVTHVLFAITLGVVSAEAAPRVSLELVTEPRFPPTASHSWYKAIVGHGVDGLRIRAQRPGEVVAPSIETRGQGDAVQVRLVGVLSPGGLLRLPGATFRIGEMGRLARYLEQLKKGKDDKQRASQARFGLTADELTQLVSRVNTTLGRTANDQTRREVVAMAGAKLGRGLSFTPGARERFQGQAKVTMPFGQLTLGTALAALFRQDGLALRPQRRGDGTVGLLVELDRGEHEVWPVGWPPERRTPQLIPAMMRRNEFEIRGVSLAEALDALRPRIGAPLLVD
ncbi:MAG: hypothetical protein ACC645_08210, partial [Pirellulales bacterium]